MIVLSIINWSVGRSIGRSVDRSIGRSITHLVVDRLIGSVDRSVDPHGPLINQLMGRSVGGRNRGKKPD